LRICVKRLWSCTAALLCVAAGEPRELPFPEEGASVETVERNVSGVARAVDSVFIFPKNPALLLRASFAVDGKDREARFGKLEAQERLAVSGVDGASWRGLDRVEGRFVLFDGGRLSVVELDEKSFKTIVERSIPWDLIRPPADRGGEATRSEIAEAQAAFKRRLLAAPPPKLAGIARVPDSWKIAKSKGMGNVYLAATRIEGFPLLQLECRSDEASQCLIARFCKLGTPLGIPPEGVAGIGLDEKRRLVVFGDTTQHGFVAYEWRSCYHLPRAKAAWRLPGKVKSLAGFSIDADGRLWVASDAADDYLNASVYLWDRW
jgi:hypothetical protein